MYVFSLSISRPDKLFFCVSLGSWRMPFKEIFCFRYLYRVTASHTNCVQYNCVRQVHTSSKITRKHGKPIISCKRPEYNHYAGQTYTKFDAIPLASDRWDHRQSKGDYFIIHGDAPKKPQEFVPKENLTQTNFVSLGIDSEIQVILNDMGIMNPTEIQFRAIPRILSGSNTLITAETGCGKTLAYLIPLLQQMLRWKPIMPQERFNRPIVLVITPSRELVMQIGAVIDELFPKFNMTSNILVGGKMKRFMMNPSFQEFDILVATLGGLSKLVTTGIYKMDCIRHVVLDEADTLLDDSFSDKLSYFLRKLPFQYQNPNPDSTSGCQLTLVSATMPTEEIDILSTFIHPDSLKRATTSKLHQISPHVPQRFMRLSKIQKPGELLKIVGTDMNLKRPVMIFSNKADTCDWISIFLNEHNIPCINLNGEMSLAIRDGRFKKFNSGQINVLSCTDVASRGLDTSRTRHVINYDFPLHTADYIHRCGRTGRLGGAEGCMVTNFVASNREIPIVKKIEHSVRLNSELPKVDGNITKVIRKRIEAKIEQMERLEMKMAAE